jgi:hypothetical protein
MNQALATYAAELIGTLQDVAAQPAPPVTLEALASILGVDPSELVRMPGCAAFYRSFFDRPTTASGALRQTVFDPAGHYRAVAEAPGSQKIVNDFEKATKGGAFFAGIMLLIIVTLEREHRDIPASINRAIAVLEGWHVRGRMKVPTGRTLKTAWKDWRHLAPLWAAFISEFLVVRSQSLSDLSAGLEALQNPVRLARALGRTKGLRSFAISFIPEHAAAPLIPIGEAVEIISGALEEEPPTLLLMPQDIEAAKAHRAPTTKFFG